MGIKDALLTWIRKNPGKVGLGAGAGIGAAAASGGNAGDKALLRDMIEQYDPDKDPIYRDRFRKLLRLDE